MRFGFCGGTYQSQSLSADAQSCINFYVERDESGQGKSDFQLLGTPGLRTFASLTGMLRVRQTAKVLNRQFAVAEDATDQYLWEIFQDGTSRNRGKLGTALFPVTMDANNNLQLLICSGARVFLYDMSGSLSFPQTPDVLSEISTYGGTQIQGPVSQVSFSDGYFIALLKDSQRFQISGLLDGSSWDPLDIFQVSEYPQNIVSKLVDHREIWFWGPEKTVVYSNTGDLDNPFQPIPGAFIEQGCAAQFSPVRLDNSIFWIGGDERGNGIAWRAQGYTPQRVSTHAVELAWQSYSTIADAQAYAYQDKGHSFWVIRFPSANKTWALDVATGQWHERQSLDGTAHRAACHTFNFGKHLVGDWKSGNIYEMSTDFLDDAGERIRRVRRAPYINEEDSWMSHSRFVLDMETGLGPTPPLLDGNGEPREPQVALRWSDDGAHTWSNEHYRGCGATGEYRRRVRWLRLGHSRQRVYEISISDPISVRIVDAYINSPTGRAVAEARASA